MSLKLNTASGGSITLQEADTASNLTITVPAVTGTMATSTTPSFTTTIGVGGATPATSGAGITFPAAQSASSDANTLDDYEEGTWTPVGTFVTQGTATSSFIGTYTKIGRQVSIIASGSVDKGNASGTFSITGVPFATAITVAVCIRTAGIGASSTVLQANLESGTGTVIKFLLAPQSTSLAGALATAANMNAPDNYIQLFCTYNI
jgi:hypothetical protein